MQNKNIKKKFFNKKKENLLSIKDLKLTNSSNSKSIKLKKRIKSKRVDILKSNKILNRSFLKFKNKKPQKRNKKVNIRALKKKVIWFKKLVFFRFFSMQKKYIVRFYLTKRNLFFVCTNFWGDVIFWFTSKQFGFRKYQLKSPYTIDAFYSMFLYYLKLNNIINFNIMLLGYNRHIKRFIKDLSDLDFTITNIIRYIPLSYNGCKRKHRRRL